MNQVSSFTERNHPPVDVSLSRTPVLYPGDSCWHCFLTSHWIRAGHNWILRGSMQCGKKRKSSILTAWLWEIDNRSMWRVEKGFLWQKQMNLERVNILSLKYRLEWQSQSKKGWKKYASWQKLSKSWFYLRLNPLWHRPLVCGHNWSV